MAKAMREAQSALEHGAEAFRKIPLEAVDAAKELATEANDHAMEYVDAARGQFSDLRDCAIDSFHAHPLRALSIALGIGCVIGIVIARR